MAKDSGIAAGQPRQLKVDWLLAAVLSMTAGTVDVIGFLALGGLFVAHITGNLVVLASHYITGGFSQVGPLMSVPVFICVLSAVTWLFTNKATHRTLRTLLILHALLLAGFFGLAIALGPFTNPDGAIAVTVGMLGVAAMATQNALVKLDLPGFPSTAVLTTNTVQLTINLVTLLRGNAPPDEIARARRGAQMTFSAVAGFIAGCAAGGFLEVHFKLWALALPVVLAVVAVPLGEYTLRAVEATEQASAVTIRAAKGHKTTARLFCE
jgi:uncharacterized membrane protein YoaK (UPF0700 family)